MLNRLHDKNTKHFLRILMLVYGVAVAHTALSETSSDAHKQSPDIHVTPVEKSYDRPLTFAFNCPDPTQEYSIEVRDGDASLVKSKFQKVTARNSYCILAFVLQNGIPNDDPILSFGSYPLDRELSWYAYDRKGHEIEKENFYINSILRATFGEQGSDPGVYTTDESWVWNDGWIENSSNTKDTYLLFNTGSAESLPSRGSRAYGNHCNKRPCSFDIEYRFEAFCPDLTCEVGLIVQGHPLIGSKEGEPDITTELRIKPDGDAQIGTRTQDHGKITWKPFNVKLPNIDMGNLNKIRVIADQDYNHLSIAVNDKLVACKDGVVPPLVSGNAILGVRWSSSDDDANQNLLRIDSVTVAEAPTPDFKCKYPLPPN